MAERPRELGDFKRCVILRLNFGLKSYSTSRANHCGPLDGEWLCYNIADGSFYTKDTL